MTSGCILCVMQLLYDNHFTWRLWCSVDAAFNVSKNECTFSFIPQQAIVPFLRPGLTYACFPCKYYSIPIRRNNTQIKKLKKDAFFPEDGGSKVLWNYVSRLIKLKDITPEKCVVIIIYRSRKQSCKKVELSRKNVENIESDTYKKLQCKSTDVKINIDLCTRSEDSKLIVKLHGRTSISL